MTAKNETVAISNKNPTINVESSATMPWSTSEKFQIRKQTLAISDNKRNRPMKALSNENLDGNSLASILNLV